MLYLQGWVRIAFLLFFTTHIPITIIMDAQVILPASLIPHIFTQLRIWYTSTYKDTLMTEPYDLFLQSFVYCEVFFQVPFFIYAVIALLCNNSNNGSSNRFRLLCLIYGSHTVTTLLPILASILCENDGATTTSMEKGILVCFYAPYLIFPMWLIVIALHSGHMFGPTIHLIPEKKED